jgi:membrane-anchored protein YejM (alkaline phosphatase superfamily)
MFSYAEGGGPITRIANLFPLNFAIDGKLFLKKYGLVKETDLPLDQHYGNLYYPANTLKCQSKSPKNVVMIVIENWPADWNQNQTPFLTHYKKHAVNFTKHFSGGINPEEGYFSLLYSLPPIYSVSVKREKTYPVLLDQMRKMQGDILFFKTSKESPVKQFLSDASELSLDEMIAYFSKRAEAQTKHPYFMQVYVGESDLSQRDISIKEVMSNLIKMDQINKSIVIVTGTHSDNLSTPFYMIWPGKKSLEVTKTTSHYDILGTILLEDWKCKNRMSDVGLGKSLLNQDESIKFVTGNYDHLMIIDAKENKMAVIDESATLKAEGAKVAEMKLILEALNRMTMFYRPR